MFKFQVTIANELWYVSIITAGVDYTTVLQTVRFAPGQSAATVSIPIKDDKFYDEQNITFTVTIIPNGDVIVMTNDPIVTIVDDDHSELICCIQL